MAANPKAVLKRNQQEADDLAHRIGPERLRAMLKRADEELKRRLHRAVGINGPGRDSFTAHQIGVALMQVRRVTTQLGLGVRGLVVSQGGRAAEKSAESLLRYLSAAEKKFGGIAQPLNLREAGILDAAREGTNASVLRRLATSGDPGAAPLHRAKGGVLARYGTKVVGFFEEELQQGFVQKKPWADVRAALVERSPFLQEAPAFWAERIVRTETMAAQNRAGLEGIKAAQEQVGGMVKILSAVFDDRTGADSIAVHGQIRRVEEPFDTWYGKFEHPPDRPNDRGTVVPHRISWPIPPFLAWRDYSEVSARWKAEGRKGVPPERPLMTTVPRSQFGRPDPSRG